MTDEEVAHCFQAALGQPALGAGPPPTIASVPMARSAASRLAHTVRALRPGCGLGVVGVAGSGADTDDEDEYSEEEDEDDGGEVPRVSPQPLPYRSSPYRM